MPIRWPPSCSSNLIFAAIWWSRPFIIVKHLFKLSCSLNEYAIRHQAIVIEEMQNYIQINWRRCRRDEKSTNLMRLWKRARAHIHSSMVFNSYDTRILSYTPDPTEIHRKRRQKRKQKRRDEDGMQRAHLRCLSKTNGNCECYRTKWTKIAWQITIIMDAELSMLAPFGYGTNSENFDRMWLRISFVSTMWNEAQWIWTLSCSVENFNQTWHERWAVVTSHKSPDALNKSIIFAHYNEYSIFAFQANLISTLVRSRISDSQS